VWNKLWVAGAIVGVAFVVMAAPDRIIFQFIADFFASIPNWRMLGKIPNRKNRLGWTLGWGFSNT